MPAHHKSLYKNDLQKYIQKKINMLEGEFYLRLTFEEKAHFRGLKTETDVDKYAHQLIRENL